MPPDHPGDALDRLIDQVTGVPLDDGEIERFSAEGAAVVAERRGNPGASVTFVLVHGIGMGRKVFADLVQRLEPRGLVVAVDLPGYGDAPEPPRTPTIERMADLVAAYVRHLGRGPAVLVGHSMGTQVVVEVAARRPEAVSGIVLVAPTVDPAHRRALSQLARLGRDLVGESLKVLVLGGREYLRAGPNLRAKMRAMLVHRPEDAFPRVQCRALVIRGETDRVSPREWCAEVVAALPDAREIEVAGHGHETLIRDAGPAAAAILDFVDGS
jgi:pimeloyl-ACP methyl ester carboxylesterase